MRNLCLIILASLIAFSCSDRLSLMKRRYNKGYYIALKHRPESNPRKETTSERLTARAVHPKNTVEATVISKNEVPIPKIENAPNAPAEKPVRIESHSVNRSQGCKPAEMPAEPYRIKTLEESQLNSRSLKMGEDVDSDVMLVILVILAIFLPPLAIYLKAKSANKWFLITLILCLLALIGYWFIYFTGLLWLAAVVIALLYVFDMLK